LLYGGAINLAGAVKGKKSSRHAVSDWMEIEKQRGISVTSSVMQFEYDGFCINILDTPGHQDFSEDTYRTLMAADSAVMVIDAGKGVELQTKKLFKICTMRHIPIITFINKMDREAKNPFELLEDIENVLGIHTCPMNWPIGSGKDFKGVYDRKSQTVLSFTANNGQKEVAKAEYSLNSPELKAEIGEYLYSEFSDEIELLEGAGDSFDLESVRSGGLTPVFFGSALTNFGVEPFLHEFLEITTPPLARESNGEVIAPDSDIFSAFCFKIQANMNKAHRDRIAFFRICSGKFDKNNEIFHTQGNKKLRLSQPQQIMAQEREVIDEAFAGDIIGVFDPGVFAIGDTVCTPGSGIEYKGIPTFAPEHFAAVRQKDTMKRKQFAKGTTQIAQEGGIQMFHEPNSGLEEVIVGVVGSLQFDVLKYRLENEYNVEIIMNNLPYRFIRWINNTDLNPQTLDLASDTKVVQDFRGNFMLLFTSEWSIQWALDHNKQLQLSEFGGM
ncbi:MAG: peptide chain release factor 3, partial [Oscillospiraceae bacterium]|nr:peptide chain release factor 3 [Oscillospiraceae bacterium]